VLKRMLSRSVTWAGRRPGVTAGARAGDDSQIRDVVDRRVVGVGAGQQVPAVPVTAVTGVRSCDVGPGGAGSTSVGSCRSTFPGQWRGRMEGNDWVKEVKQLI
jgi:hypothetical protein